LKAYPVLPTYDIRDVLDVVADIRADIRDNIRIYGQCSPRLTTSFLTSDNKDVRYQGRYVTFRAAAPRLLHRPQ
jgi:hypothetical protein